ncbi:MAG: hypothetical protein AB3N14_11350 [Flavobacteriaceae bacterium]
MNKLQRIASKGCTLVICFLALSAFGQKETKTYKESFKVGDNAVIDINTSHADIEFETWDKNEVVVEAVVELEGATKEEAKDYFRSGGVKIIGNSQQIEISTKAENSIFFGDSFGDIIVNDFVIEIPEFPELEPLFLDLEIPELPDFPEMMEMPPMPPFTIHHFDYKEYKKDGEKYMKKWKKEFDENFDEDYKRRMEEWSERMAERAEAWKERREEREADLKERLKERQDELKARQHELKERQRERQQAQKERIKALQERSRAIVLERKEADSTRVLFIDRDSLYSGPSIFFGSSHGSNKKYKVKKTIKIKMPKSAKLKMNVRHGEVKLAENTVNINATLSYARLHATTIDGDRTKIVASYSPVSVQSWDNGSLNTNFSDNVALKDVKYLKLSANSSDVTIERLLKSAYIKNNLGALRINGVAKNFDDLDISVQHGELNFELPTSPYTIYVNGTSSKVTSPAYLVWDKTRNHSNTVQRSYHMNSNAESSIIINSAYSNVVLEK